MTDAATPPDYRPGTNMVRRAARPARQANRHPPADGAAERDSPGRDAHGRPRVQPVWKLRRSPRYQCDAV